jgi:rubredoxin
MRKENLMTTIGVACPQCGAPKGTYCRDGKSRQVKFHVIRSDIAAHTDQPLLIAMTMCCQFCSAVYDERAGHRCESNKAPAVECGSYGYIAVNDSYTERQNRGRIPSKTMGAV